MSNTVKLLLCGFVAYSVQIFLLPLMVSPIATTLVTFFGENAVYDPNIPFYIFESVLLHIIPTTILLVISMYVYIRWSHEIPVRIINLLILLLIAYAAGEVLWWIFAFAMNADAAYVQLQWNLIGTVDGFQNMEGYATTYLLSWVLYLIPFLLAPFLTRYFVSSRPAVQV